MDARRQRARARYWADEGYRRERDGAYSEAAEAFEHAASLTVRRDVQLNLRARSRRCALTHQLRKP